jgi:hypothetical protein
MRSIGRVRGFIHHFEVIPNFTDSAQHPFHRIVDIIVLYAEHSISESFQESCRTGVTLHFVICRMGCGIDLNNELGFPADKIGDIAANRHLPNKFETVELAIAQFSPVLCGNYSPRLRRSI